MKKFYLFPNNDIARNLLKKLIKSEKYSFLGFIDNYNDDSIRLEEIETCFDRIIICSPKFFQAICDQLLNYGVKKSKIYFYEVGLKKILTFSEFRSWQNGCILDFNYIKNLKNKHKNQRIFLIGNGPSLQINDLNKLKNEITFAANKIYLAYEDTLWRPTYYIVEDDLVFLQNSEKISSLNDSIKIFPMYMLNFAKKLDNSYYFNLNHEFYSNDFPQFNPDPINEGMYWGSTVIYTMIQFAVYFGCKEIYMLGVDFSFDIPSKSISYEKENRIDLICEGEINHFHKDYRKLGEKWNLPNLDVQLKTFSKAKEYGDNYGIKIYNASRQTKLDVFEKVDFDVLINTF